MDMLATAHRISWLVNLAHRPVLRITPIRLYFSCHPGVPLRGRPLRWRNRALRCRCRALQGAAGRCGALQGAAPVMSLSVMAWTLPSFLVIARLSALSLQP